MTTMPPLPPVPTALVALGLGLGLPAQAAQAEPWDCRFTVECLVAEGCAAGEFGAQVIAVDHAGELVLSTVTGDSPVDRLTPEGALPATYAGAGRDGIAELLTIETDRTAILTLHIFDGQAAAITYLGTCEGMT
ncbi:hypothetical protein [Roseicyclus amphidinii]|jgi:hypothetical protein|uniref:hypothetical protein n=1 Tax=Roseicyclus amphidinii TaxID=3034232 RepID=UPI0024E0CB03|nr:hypothetical protein [Roseicyclus sp. Amp-Y-6]